MNRFLYYMMVVVFAMEFFGCASSSPRFRNDDSSAPAKKNRTEKIPHRFSSKHIEEEIAEDDHKIDAQSMAKKRRSSPTLSSDSPGKKATATAGQKKEINPDAMMDVILGYLGTPYEWGGTTKSGIDCSAFSGAVYAQSTTITLPRTTDAQVKEGKTVALNELKFGDLLFFNTTGVSPSHVGIYIGDDLFAHASEAFGVTISSLNSRYYKKRFTEAKRILE